jgi:hypothetical protein
MNPLQTWNFILKNERGVCLAEFLVSLTTGAIVLAASLQTFTLLHAQATKQQRVVSHQQDLRVGMEVFEQEVRLATADAIGTASEREFVFRANINAQRTTLTTAVSSGQSVLPVVDGSGWGRGKTVLLCAQQTCESHALVRDGQRQQLVLAEPVGTDFPVGASVEVTNRVVYYARHDPSGVLRLMRMVDGGANVLVGELDSVRLSYWDELGRAAHSPSMIKRVVIEVTSKRLSRPTIHEVSLRS